MFDVDAKSESCFACHLHSFAALRDDTSPRITLLLFFFLLHRSTPNAQFCFIRGGEDVTKPWLREDTRLTTLFSKTGKKTTWSLLVVFCPWQKWNFSAESIISPLSNVCGSNGGGLAPTSDNMRLYSTARTSTICVNTMSEISCHSVCRSNLGSLAISKITLWSYE